MSLTREKPCNPGAAGPDPTPLTMRVSLAGLLKNVADELDRMAADLRRHEGFHEDEDGDSPDPAEDAGWMAFVLREVARHAAGVAAGEHSLAEFGRHYCLTEGVVPDPFVLALAERIAVCSEALTRVAERRA